MRPVMHWRMVLAAVSWTAMFCLAVARSLLSDQALVVWVLVAGFVALVMTGWCLAEDIAERMVRRALRAHEMARDQAVEQLARRITATLREERLTSVR